MPESRRSSNQPTPEGPASSRYSANPPESWDVSSGAGVTALGLAAARSVETGRPDRLAEDPFARALFEAANVDLPMLVDWPEAGGPVSDAEALHLHGSRYIGLRTRHYDDAALAACREGIRQGVLLGAGLDTRAFRLDLPNDFRLFELDQQPVLDFKDATLGALGVESHCMRSTIGTDLREDWRPALEASGFEPGRPTIWVAEGLLAYLSREAQTELLGAIHELSAPGSALALDRISGDPTAPGRLRGLSERSGIDMERLLVTGTNEDLAGFLNAKGWDVHEEPTAIVADRYRRDLSNPFPPRPAGSQPSEPPWLDTIFLSAHQPA